MAKEENVELVKNWSIDRVMGPLFGGGRIETNVGEDYLFSLHQGSVHITSLRSSLTSSFPLSLCEESVSVVAVHPSSQPPRVVVGVSSGLIHSYSVDIDSSCVSSSDVKCELLRTVRAHSMPISSLCFDSSGVLLCSGASDGSVKVWDLERGVCTHVFNTHSQAVHRLFLPKPKSVGKDGGDRDGNSLTLFSSSDDNTISVCDLSSSSCIAHLTQHMSLPTAMAISQNGNIFVSGGRDKVLNFYNANNNYSHLKTFLVMDVIESIVILSDQHSKLILKDYKQDNALCSNVLLVGGESGTIFVYSLSQLKDGSISCQKISNLFINDTRGEVEITLKENMENEFLELISRNEIPNFDKTKEKVFKNCSVFSEPSNPSKSESIHQILYLKKNSEIIVTTSECNIYTFPISSNMEGFIKDKKQLVGSNDDVLDIKFIPSIASNSEDQDENAENVLSSNYHIGVVTNSPQVKIFDQDFTCQSLHGHSDIVLALDVSPDGQWLSTASKDKTVRLWSTNGLSCVAICKGHADAVGCVAMSRNEHNYSAKQNFITSGGSDKVLKKWEFSEKLMSQVVVSSPLNSDVDHKYIIKLNATKSVKAHEKDITTTAISPNDLIIATGSQDKTIKLWQSDSLKLIQTLSGHKRSVWKVIFSQVDKVLVSSSGDRTIKMWSIADFSCLRTLEGHTASVLSIQYVNLGRQLLSASADGIIKLWTLRSGACEKSFDNHLDKVWTIATPDESFYKLNEKKKGDLKIGGIDDDENIVEDVEKNKNRKLIFFSGSSDSQIILWKDVTKEEEDLRIKTIEHDIILEQEMQNDLHHKRYDKALMKALSLGHSNRVLTILKCILDNEEVRNVEGSEGEEEIKLEILSEYVKLWKKEDIEKILNFLLEWNTNSRNSYVCLMIVNSLFSVHGFSTILSHEHFKQSLSTMVAYSERHYQRIGKLHESSYLSNYVLSVMSFTNMEETKTNVKEIQQAEEVQSNTNKRKNTISKKTKPVIFDDINETKKLKLTSIEK